MTQLEMKYFVLKPRSKVPGDVYARASRKAMRAYAEMIKFEHPIFANQIKEWAKAESIKDPKSLKEV